MLLVPQGNYISQILKTTNLFFIKICLKNKGIHTSWPTVSQQNMSNVSRNNLYMDGNKIIYQVHHKTIYKVIFDKHRVTCWVFSQIN